MKALKIIGWRLVPPLFSIAALLLFYWLASDLNMSKIARRRLVESLALFSTSYFCYFCRHIWSNADIKKYSAAELEIYTDRYIMFGRWGLVAAITAVLFPLINLSLLQD